MPIRHNKVTARDDDERDYDEGLVLRDYVLARIAVAMAALDSARETLTQAAVLFTTPDEDRKGKERKECIDNAIESASIATRALEDAFENIDECDLEAGEPWEEEDDDPDGAD